MNTRSKNKRNKRSPRFETSEDALRGPKKKLNLKKTPRSSSQTLVIEEPPLQGNCDNLMTKLCINFLENCI